MKRKPDWKKELEATYKIRAALEPLRGTRLGSAMALWHAANLSGVLLNEDDAKKLREALRIP